MVSSTWHCCTSHCHAMAATSLIKCNVFSKCFVERKKKTWPTMTMTKAPRTSHGLPPRHQPGQHLYRPSRINPTNLIFEQNLSIFASLWTILNKVWTTTTTTTRFCAIQTCAIYLRMTHSKNFYITLQDRCIIIQFVSTKKFTKNREK